MNALLNLVALTVVAGAMIPPTAGAQTPTPPTRPAADTVGTPLTVEEAVARAVEGSEEVRLARATVDLAGEQVTAARSAALPQLDAVVNYTRTFASPFGGGGGFTIPDSMRFEPDPNAPLEERVAYLEDNADKAALGALGGLFGNLPFGRENSYIAALSGSQLLYSGGRTGAAMSIARSYEHAARLTYRERVAEIELQVRRAYFSAALARELEAIATAALAQARSFLEQQQLRFEVGTASELDLLRAEVSAENLQPQVVQARNAAELAMLDLKRLIDVPLNQPIRLATGLQAPAPPTHITREAALEETSRRAAVEAAEAQVDIRRQQVRIARGAFLPELRLSVNYGGQLFPTSPFAIGSATWNKDISASVGLQIPIFSGLRRQAELAQARIAVEQAELELGQLREAVQLEYEQARGERERALASIAARQRTVEQASRVHDLTVLRYESGLATQLEVSEARLALLQARTNVAQAIADYYIADAGYARALGIRGTSRGAGNGTPASTIPPTTPPVNPASAPPLRNPPSGSPPPASLPHGAEPAAAQ